MAEALHQSFLYSLRGFARLPSLYLVRGAAAESSLLQRIHISTSISVSPMQSYCSLPYPRYMLIPFQSYLYRPRRPVGAVVDSCSHCILPVDVLVCIHMHQPSWALQWRSGIPRKLCGISIGRYQQKRWTSYHGDCLLKAVDARVRTCR